MRLPVSTVEIDMMFVVRGVPELKRTIKISLEICFIDLVKAYDSVDRVLL